MPAFDMLPAGPLIHTADVVRLSNAPSPNWMRRIVQWMRNNETPLIQKVGIAVLAAITTLAAGYLVGHTLLVFTATALVVGLWAAVESNDITKAEKQRVLNTNRAVREAEQNRVAQQSSFAKMQAAVGGAEAWEAIPVLDIGERMGSTGYLDFIQGRELIAPIMKGRDRQGRPFLTMKLRLRENGGGPQVVTIFQRYLTGGRWTYAAFGTWPFSDIFGNRDWDTLRQIVTGQHARFQLVPPRV